MNEQIRKITNEIFSMEEFEYAEEFLNDEFMEKFAELIVRECMIVGDKAMQDNKWPSEIIKIHFGVDR